MFDAKENGRPDYIVYKKTLDDKINAKSLKNFCEFYVLKDGKKVDTYLLSAAELVFVALTNKNIDLSKITCERQKIRTYERLSEFLMFENQFQTKQQKKFFAKIIEQLGGKIKYESLINLSKQHNMPVERLIKHFIDSKCDPSTPTPPIYCPPLPGQKNIKLTIPPLPPQPKKSGKEKI